MFCQDKDAFKKRASELETELVQRSDTSSATERIMREKDEQINELLEEGLNLCFSLIWLYIYRAVV